MCFELYVGTQKGLEIREWNEAKPDISVETLTAEASSITTHFSKPAVQYIGSTSRCGCDFPHLMRQGVDWPAPLEKDPEQTASDRINQEALVALLRETGDKFVELYGIWSGNISEPQVRKEIQLKDLLDPDFYFKEQGFYRVLV